MKAFTRRSVLRSGAAVAAGAALTGTAAAQPLSGEDERTDAEFDFSKAPAATSCRLLARTINKVKARARVVPGIVNGTYVLVVSGRKPYLNMTVQLVPVIYTHQPDYWRIEVVGCLHGIALPMVAPYSESISIDQCRGKKGIEVVWADDKETINVP